MLDFSRFKKRLSNKDKIEFLNGKYIVKVRNSRKEVSLPLELNENLAYFIGLFVGDGGLKNTKKLTANGKKAEYKIILGDFSKEYTLKIQQRFYELFDFKPPVRTDRINKGEHFYYINPTSKAVHLFLTEVIGLKEGKYEKFVPELIIKSNKTLQTAFLRGYFDAEGSIYRKHKRKTWVVSVHAKEHELLRSIQKLLVECFDIEVTRIYSEANASKLCITHQKDIYKLAGKVLFNHPDKICKLAAVAQPDITKQKA